MPWELTDDLDRFVAHAWTLLSSEPVRRTIELTLIGQLQAGRRWSAEPVLFGWYADQPGGVVTGAVLRTLPYEMLLSAVPEEGPAMHELVAALRSRADAIPGVNAETAVAERFAAMWAAAGGSGTGSSMRTRLYALDQLRPPSPAPAGLARLAEDADAELLTAWFAAFQREVHGGSREGDSFVSERIAQRLLWVWEVDGEVCSFAGRNQPAARVVRVGPVYTPPEHRRKGLGAAVTGACTADAQAAGADDVVLFTDLDNPTSNAIYQQIGYRPVGDHAVIRFAS